MKRWLRIIATFGIAFAINCGGGGGSSNNGGGTVTNVAPTITQAPVAATVAYGSTATFTVAATGTPAPTYQWRANGVNAGTGSTLQVVGNDQTAGMVDVVVSNVAGTVTSTPVKLTVTDTLPVITAQSAQNLIVVQGSPVTLTVTATGPHLQYEWQKDGVAVASTASYTFNASTTGIYNVKVTNAAGSVMGTALTVAVTPAPGAVAITTQPQSTSVALGSTATFNVVASGTTPSYQWKKNGVNIGTNSASYSFTTLATDNSATISVVVSNSVNSVTSSNATLTVTGLPQAVAITTQPQSQTVAFGSPVTFTVVATGTGPISYQWKKNNTYISGPNSASYTFTPTASDANAVISVIVSNSVNALTSASATLTITGIPQPVAITTQPQSQTAAAGQTATFAVVATGATPINYQWYWNGAPVGTNSASYTTNVLSYANNGSQLSVTVSNAVNQVVSNTVTLTVTSAPTITSQPTNQSVSFGSAATFSVVAAGTAPITYQWTKAGVNVGTNSPSYTFTPTMADNSAPVQVTVTNTYGSVQSNQVNLTLTNLLDLSVGKVRLNQAIQLEDDSVPLVAGRSLVFQVFVLTNQTTTILPTVQVQIFNGATLLQTVSGNATSSLKTTLDTTDPKGFVNLKVDGVNVASGYTYKVTVDPNSTISDVDRSNNVATGTISATTVHPVPVNFVPLVIGGKTGRISTSNWYSLYGQWVEMQWPVPDAGMNVTVASPYTVTSVTNTDPTDSQWNLIISELEAKRIAENTGKYYYGAMYNSGSGSGYSYAGLAILTGKTGIGRDDQGFAYAHELCHNFGKGHVSCNGNVGNDPGYPYANGQVVGYGANIIGNGMNFYGTLYNLPTKTSVSYDFMSYCTPYWISDYNYKYLMNRINVVVPAAAFQVSNNELVHDTGTTSSSLIWGTYNSETNTWSLEPTFTLGSYYDPNEESAKGSNIEIQGLDKTGKVVMRKEFKPKSVCDESVKSHSFAVRVNNDAELVEIRIVENGKVVARQTSNEPIEEPNMVYTSSTHKTLVHSGKAVMLMNEKGEVVSIIRGDVQTLEESGKHYTMHVSNGVRSQRFERSFE